MTGPSTFAEKSDNVVRFAPGRVGQIVAPPTAPPNAAHGQHLPHARRDRCCHLVALRLVTTRTVDR